MTGIEIIGITIAIITGCESSNIEPFEHFRDVTRELIRTNQHGDYIAKQQDIALTRYG